MGEAAQGAMELKDIKGLEHFQYSPLLFAAGALILVLVAIALFYCFRRRKLAAIPEPAVPPRPAHEVAFEALGALVADDDFNPVCERLFHFSISEIVRRYLEARFGISTTDMTTEEIAERLPGTSIDRNEIGAVLAILMKADCVKFAEMLFGREAAIGLKGESIGFVERTREMERVAVEAGS
ncbi:MAG: hypothetical protein V2A66_09660 [Pseudomonadota bacterium]